MLLKKPDGTWREKNSCMTKYVLNSGGMTSDSEKSKEFVAEVVSGLGENPRVLFCFFASPREDWEESFGTYKKVFIEWAPVGVEPVFVLAFPATFEQQCHESDIIYIHGGDDHLLQYWIKQFDIPKIWEDKTVATNSASTHMMADSFWTCDWRMCMRGLGIMPIKTIAHYGSAYGGDDPRGPIDWQAAKDELANYGDKILPIYALEEADYVVFNL